MGSNSLRLWVVLSLAVLSCGSAGVLGSALKVEQVDRIGNFNAETGEIETTDAEGNPQTIKLELPEGSDYASVFPLIVTDKAGNEYQVSDENPDKLIDEDRSVGSSKVDQGKRHRQLKLKRVERVASFDSGRLESKHGTIRFVASGDSRFAFDPADEAWYQRAVKLDEYYKPFAKGYIAPWKLIPVGEQDVVLARYEGTADIDLSRVRFASAPSSPALPAELDPKTKTWRLTLPATEASKSYDVFALYQSDVIGKLRVVSEELSKGSKYEEVEGLMQRGRRFGYIFAGNSHGA